MRRVRESDVEPDAHGVGRIPNASASPEGSSARLVLEGSSFRRPIEVNATTLRLSLFDFEPESTARIFSTPRTDGTYRDVDAVELTAGPVRLNEAGWGHIQLPCAYAAGQAYRITALVGAADATRRLGSGSDAVRADIVDLLPTFTSANVHPLADSLDKMLDDCGMFSCVVSAARSGDQEAALEVFMGADYGAADVDVSYELGVEGVFGKSISIPGTRRILPGGVSRITIDLPTIRQPAVVRVQAVFTSPNGQFAPKTRWLGIAARPVNR